MTAKRTTSEMYTGRPARAVAFGLLALAIGLMLVFGRSDAALAAVSGTDVTYTLDAEFDQGTLLNVNHNAPNNDQLQLNQTAQPFPFVNIAASARGTIVRIDVNTGAVLGEYLTSPDGQGRNPSRTTVDLLGNVWVANRAEHGFSPAGSPIRRGSVTRVGLVTGGTRVNSDGSGNPVGDYLAAPFGYNTCVDRDSDTLIKTSRGLADIRSWTNAGGADTHGGVSTADDECVINYTRVRATGTRTVAVDASNDIWVGGIFGFGPFYNHEKVDGITGAVVAGTFFNVGCGGYGGFIDGNGVLWSAASNGVGLLRWDTATPIATAQCLTGRGNYGLGLDPNTGHVWHSSLGFTNRLYELDAAGAILNSFPQPFGAQGVAVDGNSHVWMAKIFGIGAALWHLAPQPGPHIPVGIVPGFLGTTGVAVDANGMIWASETGNRASRVDPSAGPIGGGGFPVGAISLSVGLGAGAGPYNYSDMTGFVAIGATSPQGTWTVVQDGGAVGTAWGNVSWNGEAQGSEPAGTSITVQARASDTEAGLSGEVFVAVSNGVDFSLTGQFIEVRATLLASPAGVSPILSDLRIRTTGVDADPPRCEVISVNPAPPATVSVEVEDPDSGVVSIEVLTLVNATVEIPTGSGNLLNQGDVENFAPSEKSLIPIEGVKSNPGSSTLRIRVTDAAGNVTECDPVLVSLTSEPGSRVARQTVSSLPNADRYLTLFSDDPSAGFVLVTVNNKWFTVLTGAETIDVGSALVEGFDNTITLWGWGAEGLVMISDMVPPHDSGPAWAPTRWERNDSWRPW